MLRCSVLRTQANYMEADGLQLRAWLEEVILANEALEARVDALEASAAAAIHEKAALEGWVRGSVAEQAAASTRLASFQVMHPPHCILQPSTCTQSPMNREHVYIVRDTHHLLQTELKLMLFPAGMQLSRLLCRHCPGCLRQTASARAP